MPILHTVYTVPQEKVRFETAIICQNRRAAGHKRDASRAMTNRTRFVRRATESARDAWRQ